MATKCNVEQKNKLGKNKYNQVKISSELSELIFYEIYVTKLYNYMKLGNLKNSDIFLVV